ncbi:MAG: DUF5698 domain-containing protein [Oscillospiraceae bacterium]
MAIFLLCVKVFFCRILDVTLGTIRTILTVREKPSLASLMGFMEVMIWFLVVREALSSDQGGLYTAVAYAGGFAAGTFIGGKIAKKFVKSNIVAQVVTTDKNDELIRNVRAAGFAASVVDVKESDFSGEKYMLFCEITSGRLKEFKQLVHSMDERAFIMVQDTKYVYNGFMRKK